MNNSFDLLPLLCPRIASQPDGLSFTEVLQDAQSREDTLIGLVYRQHVLLIHMKPHQTQMLIMSRESG